MKVYFEKSSVQITVVEILGLRESDACFSIVISTVSVEKRLGDKVWNYGQRKMGEAQKICWFDHISDDIVLRIFYFIPRNCWYGLNDVSSRFRRICNDRTLFR